MSASPASATLKRHAADLVPGSKKNSTGSIVITISVTIRISPASATLKRHAADLVRGSNDNSTGTIIMITVFITIRISPATATLKRQAADWYEVLLSVWCHATTSWLSS